MASGVLKWFLGCNASVGGNTEPMPEAAGESNLLVMDFTASEGVHYVHCSN